MKRYDIIPAIFWIGLSIFVMLSSLRLGLGSFHKPGPGLMPFLLGALLTLISSYLFIDSIAVKERGSQKGGDCKTKANFGKVGLVSASLLIYALVLEKLGYLVATFLLLTLVLRSVASIRWNSLLIISALTALITYFGFTSLGLRFPMGILR